MFFDNLSDVMVVLVKSRKSYVILNKHYLTDPIKALHLCDKFFAPIGIVDGEFKTIPTDKGYFILVILLLITLTIIVMMSIFV